MAGGQPCLSGSVGGAKAGPREGVPTCSAEASRPASRCVLGRGRALTALQRSSAPAILPSPSKVGLPCSAEGLPLGRLSCSALLSCHAVAPVVGRVPAHALCCCCCWRWQGVPREPCPPPAPHRSPAPRLALLGPGCSWLMRRGGGSTSLHCPPPCALWGRAHGPVGPLPSEQHCPSFPAPSKTQMFYGPLEVLEGHRPCKFLWAAPAGSGLCLPHLPAPAHINLPQDHSPPALSRAVPTGAERALPPRKWHTLAWAPRLAPSLPRAGPFPPPAGLRRRVAQTPPHALPASSLLQLRLPCHPWPPSSPRS